MWIQPLFTIIPLNSRYLHQNGKFGFIFDTNRCAINDRIDSFRQNAKKPREDRAYVAETTPTAAAPLASSSNIVIPSSSLLMAVLEEVSD